MALEPGARLGPYEVISPLGAGGMGEVYRARDTKLGRDVALKVLPEAFTSDPDRLARFEREAKVLASLNHPHIAHIYGLEEADGQKALVLELVEGPTLADRIAQGTVPLDEALPIAKQIAEALEAAHEQGIIHRDLKPANVKVRPDGTVKVLDFGLAKAFEPEGEDPDASQSPTLTARATQMGVILGTAAYMAPEQARGKTVDKRADIWAFGVVLYEMLSGARAFPGEDVSQTLARVIDRDPDWSQLPRETPVGVVRLLRRCLRKDRGKRLHDVADARLEVEEAGEPSSATPAPEGTRLAPAKRLAPWGIAALMALLAAVMVIRSWVRPAPSPTRAHLQITLPEGLRLAIDTAHPTLALSPDGSRLVFVATDGRVRRLYKRELRAAESEAIPGTEGAASPFFSLDGAWIGFSAGYKVMKVPSSSGAPVAVHTTTPPSVHRGSTWAANDTIVHASSVNSGLALGSAGGEKVLTLADWKPVTSLTAPFSWPSALPGGRTVLFTDNADLRLEAARLAEVSLDTGEVTALGVGGTNPRYSPTGHVVYGRGGALYATPFDPRSARATGPEIKVVDGVAGDGDGSVQYAVGGRTLAYVAGASDAGEYELVQVDRQGEAEVLLDPSRPLFDPRLSPDGSQLAATVLDGSNMDVWLFALERRTLIRRLTTHPGEDFGPVWHPDGQQLAVGSEITEDEDEGPVMAWISRVGELPVPLMRTPGPGHWELPSSWSPDGRSLAFVATRGEPSGDILIFSSEDPENPKSLLATSADERSPVFSPDGRWIAYVSDDTGRFEVYVQPFPGPGNRTPVSSGGGTEPVWARNGRELFFRNGDHLMVTRVDGSGERFVAGDPMSLFQISFDDRSDFASGGANYDVSLDGTRFVLPRRKHPIKATVIDVVLNWPETLLEASEPKN